jgi:hypothetical protein
MPTILAKDMKLRDVVRMKRTIDEVFPWSTCAVTAISKEKVTLQRPYGHTESFSYGDNPKRVIFMIGMEVYDILLDSSLEYELLERPAEPR